MSQLRVPNEKITVNDENGKVLFEAPMLDLYYTMVSVHDDTVDTKVNMKNITDIILKEFGGKLTWGQTAYLLGELNLKLDAVKNDTTEKQG